MGATTVGAIVGPFELGDHRASKDFEVTEGLQLAEGGRPMSWDTAKADADLRAAKLC
jgi:hypothetical protein